MLVNGKKIDLGSLPVKSSFVSLKDMIEHLGIEPCSVAAQVNECIIKRQVWSEYQLKDNDSVELIRFVGGG